MAIEFFNIKNGRRERLTNQHTIAAYINSSDMHVNAGQGQDFGWRLAPVDVARINKLKADPSRLEEIARHLGKPVGDIRQVDFVKYVSYLDDIAAKTKEANESDTPAYLEQYEAELKALQKVDIPLPDEAPAEEDPKAQDPAEPAAKKTK